MALNHDEADDVARLFDEIALDIGASSTRFSQDPIVRANEQALIAFISAVRENEVQALRRAIEAGDEHTYAAVIKACGDAMTIVAQSSDMIARRVQSLERQASGS